MPELLRKYLDFDIELSIEDKKYLPLFHVCTQDKMLEYLIKENIVIQEICDVFGKKILYTFYGASKYNSGKAWLNASEGDTSVCLILNIDDCETVSNIFPLDTGLASGKTKGTREYIIPWDKIQTKLDLGSQKTRINKLVLHCFKSIEDYIDGKIEVKDGTVEAKYIPDRSISHINDLHKIVKDQSVGDDRRYFIEVLFEEKLALMPGRLIGVIASQDLLESSIYLSQLEKYRVKSTILENSLYYPSSFQSNLDTERKLTEISIMYSKRKFKEQK